MYIYKIVNIINNKVYIGQSICPIEQRFQRHLQDALSGRLDTHLARAIRKYGKENFTIELIDNSATNQEELTRLETYWIQYYDSIHTGYNETDAAYKSGGNTYLSKTEDEMKIIKEKIRQTKLGGKNPQSRKVKCLNTETNEEFHFDSLSEMQLFLNGSNHNFITRRCLGEIRCLYKGIWNIAYEENNYFAMTKTKGSARARQIQVEDLINNNTQIYPSYAEAARQLGLNAKSLNSKARRTNQTTFVYQNQYKITILN